MTDDPGNKQVVELELSAALVREAREVLGDVSASVEASLRRQVEREKLLREPDFQQRLKATIDLANGFYQQHGVWGEEFSTL
jgi:Post-segregation antitoxin CcdA